MRLSPLKRQKCQHHRQCEGQDRQCQGKDSGQGGEKILVKTHTGKTSNLWPVGCISDQFPTRGTPTTSLRLAREVSASHEKSGPGWCVGPDARHEHHHRRVWMNESPCHAGTTAGSHAEARPDKSLNVVLTGYAAITSPSSPTLPHTKLNPRHSSTIYDAHKPRLRLGRGKLGRYSGGPRRAQTTQGGGQVSRSEQSSPATRRLPRQGIVTWLQCTPTDSDVRWDVPAADHCNSFLLPLVPLPL
jgi:hypothetical protein